VDYDQAYRDTATYFGGAPDPLLERWASRLDPRQPVLDVGCGQGRNTVYLARRGLTVDAVDPSRVAIDQLRRQISREPLPVQTVCASFSDARLERSNYGGILMFGLLQELEWPDIGSLRWVRSGPPHHGITDRIKAPNGCQESHRTCRGKRAGTPQQFTQ
jgi:SAM-dependent methyltransferase